MGGSGGDATAIHSDGGDGGGLRRLRLGTALRRVSSIRLFLKM